MTKTPKRTDAEIDAAFEEYRKRAKLRNMTDILREIPPMADAQDESGTTIVTTDDDA